MIRILAAAAGATLVLAGLAIAVPQKDAFNLTANLKARFEVPKPAGVRAGAVGLLTGKAVEQENDKARITWRVTFSKLSGRAAAAHIHVGKPGKAGGVMVALCGPCRNGQRGVANITHAQLRTIRNGGAYVNLHTAKNAAGEIRGQVKASKASSGGDSGSAPGDPGYPPGDPGYDP